MTVKQTINMCSPVYLVVTEDYFGGASSEYSYIRLFTTEQQAQGYANQLFDEYDLETLVLVLDPVTSTFVKPERFRSSQLPRLRRQSVQPSESSPPPLDLNQESPNV